MEPTFTGVRNIGFLKTAFDHSKINLIKRDDLGWQKLQQMPGPDFQIEEGFLLNMQLTDDYFGKHYTDFKNALEKSRLPYFKFKNPINKNFLNIFINRELYKEKGITQKETTFFINDRGLVLEDKNLPFFTYLAKLVREIAHKPVKDFVVNNDYLESEDLSRGMCIGEDMIGIFGKNFYDEARAMHEPSSVKIFADEMDNVIESEMMDYFNK